MHARAAYIRSFGTTGILLVASLLMLAMVGAVVGFHRWPGGSVVQNVPSVPLKPTSTTHLRVVRPTAATAHVHKTPASRQSRHAAAAADASTAGLVKVVPVRSPGSLGYPVGFSPGHLSPTGTATQPSNAGGSPGTQPRPPEAPSAPSAPQPLQQLVDEITQSVPPPTGLPEHGQPIELQIPIVGGPDVKTPPLP